jgi:rod shape-determining protein MreB
MFSWIKGFFSSIGNDMAIDLGTANTLVYVKGRGIVVNEPSVVVLNANDGKLLAIGLEAKTMLGRTPGTIKVIRPMKDGVIADFQVAEDMLKAFIEKGRNKKSFIKPRIAICIPSGITEVEKRAVRDSAENAGAREIFLVEEPMAAAIGVNLPIDTPTGNMVIDIGGGTTEVAVISLDGIVTAKSIRPGGDEIDSHIDQYLKKNHNPLVGEQTAECIEMNIGSGYSLEEEGVVTIKGRDLVTGIPKTQKITSREIRNAIKDPVEAIVSTVKETLEATPPELASDLVDKGIYMCGGGSLLRGIDKLLNHETNLPTKVADNALTCIVEGTGMILENIERYEKILT